MPFCLSNTPANYGGYVKWILANKLEIVYLNNILIYTHEVDLVNSI